jgi:hypothetical protein
LEIIIVTVMMQGPMDEDDNSKNTNHVERKWSSAMEIADLAACNVQALRTMDAAMDLGSSFSPGHSDVICARVLEHFSMLEMLGSGKW